MSVCLFGCVCICVCLLAVKMTAKAGTGHGHGQVMPSLLQVASCKLQLQQPQRQHDESLRRFWAGQVTD